VTYRRIKWVDEGVDTWLTVPLKGVRIGGGRDGLVGDAACNTERHRHRRPTANGELEAGRHRVAEVGGEARRGESVGW
jgi:hypothetical protein